MGHADGPNGRRQTKQLHADVAQQLECADFLFIVLLLLIVTSSLIDHRLLADVEARGRNTDAADQETKDDEPAKLAAGDVAEDAVVAEVGEAEAVADDVSDLADFALPGVGGGLLVAWHGVEDEGAAGGLEGVEGKV